jgi:hypothetical protein
MKPISEDRELTAEESRLVRSMLERGGPDAAAFLSQSSRIRVVSRCACGCASIDFSVDGIEHEGGGMHIIADFLFGEGDSLAGALVFEKYGRLAGLEVYGLGGDAPPTLPSAVDLRPWSTGVEAARPTPHRWASPEPDEREPVAAFEIEVNVDGVRYAGTFVSTGDTVNVRGADGPSKSESIGQCRPEVVARALLLELVREHLKKVTKSPCPPMLNTISYDTWLALTPSERVRVARDWISNLGENIHIPKEAGRRLRQSSPLPIVLVRVGIFHMGEYVLNPELRRADLVRAPAPMKEVFDGFFVQFTEHNPRLPWSPDTLCEDAG